MRIIVRPLAEPRREIDVTHRLVSVIAEELWRLYGGSDEVNWLEAERHLETIAGGGLRPECASALPRRERGGGVGSRRASQHGRARPAGRAVGSVPASHSAIAP